MLKPLSRKIYITSDIDNEAYTSFSKKLTKLELDKKNINKPVEIELVSGGGETYAALAFYGRIKASLCQVNVTAYGLVASAATAILAAGEVRRMAKSAWVMIHEDSVEGIDGLSVSDIEREAAQARRLENQWSKLLSECTTTEYEDWVKLHKTEKFLTPEQCLKLGLIEEVI